MIVVAHERSQKCRSAKKCNLTHSDQNTCILYMVIWPWWRPYGHGGHEKISIFDDFRFFFNPFTGDFDLPKRICLNGLCWFSFNKVRHFLSKFSTLMTSQKKCFLHFLMQKCYSTSFSK
jgi:hypothetical protein